ncbi:hypothetical protein Trydic_g17715 [Trypoxylus dichotomus]
MSTDKTNAENFDDYIRNPQTFGKDNDKIVYPDDKIIFQYDEDKAEVENEDSLIVSSRLAPEDIVQTQKQEEANEKKEKPEENTEDK